MIVATYDCGVASVFQQAQGPGGVFALGPMQYVGILQDIILLDYGTISIPVVLFKCDWVKNEVDRRGHPTYKRDEDGFLLANFNALKAHYECMLNLPIYYMKSLFTKLLISIFGLD
jgi:hypothetical protein